MKRPITRPGTITWKGTAISLAACCLILIGGPAFAQLPPPPTLPASPTIPATAPKGIQPAFGDAAAKDTEASAVFQRSGNGIVLTGGQMAGRKGGEDETDFDVPLDLPGPDKLFQRLSEADVKESIREKAKKRPGTGRVTFPEYTPLTRETQVPPRHYGQMVETVEPNVLCHGRLYFEQPNFERQGWDLGVLSPAVCLGVFWYDVALLPYHHWTRPCQRYDCNAGKCLPGDPTPLYLYHEEFSLTGAVGQAAAIVGGFYVFP